MEDKTSLPVWSRIEQVILEASSALATLDAVRLEQLVAWCRDFDGPKMLDVGMPAEARRAIHRKVVVLHRILEVTKANLHVLGNLDGIPGKIEYVPGFGAAETVLSIRHGND